MLRRLSRVPARKHTTDHHRLPSSTSRHQQIRWYATTQKHEREHEHEPSPPHRHTRTHGPPGKRVAAPSTTTITEPVQPKSLSVSLSPTEAQQRLAVQRLRRPLAPHLSIYKWQMTSVLSSLERITGLLLAGGVYGFSLTYLASASPLPLLDCDLSSTSIAAAFAAWSTPARLGIKFLVAFPCALHAFNGLRFLAWDCGKLMANRQVVWTGWVAVGAAMVSAAWLAVL
ncbi:succinate dehydrogenase cytochrome b560 subunit [Phlyctema vagabunda]|uniref:Succinate dehydrogenase cytochrome b560 subunit n=1 Tax=Phlyctema vagabunda TaxID=108571 RepID=A0ABR4PLX4_9HELO